jgi:hypothetical protein
MEVDDALGPSRRPVPSHPPTRRLRALVRAATVGGDHPSWVDFAPYVQLPATHDRSGVALRRSSRRAALVGNIKRVYRTKMPTMRWQKGSTAKCAPLHPGEHLALN